MKHTSLKLQMSKKHIIYGLHDFANVVDEIKEYMVSSRRKILAFTGPIGAGKTTLIKKLIHKYGIDEAEVISPTFNYVNIYKIKNQTIYHFDLYRLNSAQEFVAMDFDEYLNDSDAIVIIEWPEIIMEQLKGRALLCQIEYIDDVSRELTILPL